MAGEELVLKLIMQMKDEASQHLDGMKGKLGGVNLSAAALGGIAVAGVGMLTAALFDAGKAAAEEEVGVNKLAAAVKASGGDWATASEEIEAYLSAELKRVALDDGEGRESIKRLTEATGDYQKALDLMPLAIDLATAKSIPLATASEIVGKVAAGNTGILSRYGITLKEGATSAEALAEMQKRFAGQGEAAANSYVGQQKRMEIAMGNLKETVGGLVLPIMTQFATTLADLAMKALPYVQNAIAAAGPIFQNVFGWIRDNVVPILTAIVGYVMTYWPQVQTIIGLVMEAVRLVIETVLGIVQGLFTAHGGELMTIVQTMWSYIQGTIQNVLTIIQGIVNLVLSLIKGDWQGAWQAIQDIAIAVWDQIKLVVDTAINLVQTIISIAVGIIKAAWETDWGGIRTFLETTWESIRSFIDDIAEKVKDIVEDLLGTVQEWWGDALLTLLGNTRSGWDMIRSAIKDYGTRIVDTVKTMISSVLASFTSVNWPQIGTDIVEGIKNGLSGALAGLVARAVEIARAAFEAAKGALGIGSPSKVMEEEVGVPFVTGIMVGITKEMPKLREQVRREMIGLVKEAQKVIDEEGLPDEINPPVKKALEGEKRKEWIDPPLKKILGGEMRSEWIDPPIKQDKVRRGADGREIHYHLEYIGITKESGIKDALEAMRKLEWMARMRYA